MTFIYQRSNYFHLDIVCFHFISFYTALCIWLPTAVSFPCILIARASKCSSFIACETLNKIILILYLSQINQVDLSHSRWQCHELVESAEFIWDKLRWDEISLCLQTLQVHVRKGVCDCFGLPCLCPLPVRSLEDTYDVFGFEPIPGSVKDFLHVRCESGTRHLSNEQKSLSKIPVEINPLAPQRCGSKFKDVILNRTHVTDYVHGQLLCNSSWVIIT